MVLTKHWIKTKNKKINGSQSLILVHYIMIAQMTCKKKPSNLRIKEHVKLTKTKSFNGLISI